METRATIMIPAYNIERFVSRTLESALNQSYQGAEILLIDDGSTDKTLEIAQNYERTYPGRIRVIHQENRGIGATRNRLLEESSGNILLGLDGDDFLDLKAVELVVETFEKNPGIGFVYTDQMEIDEQGNVIGKRFRAACHDFYNELIYHCHFPGHLRSFRKSLLREERFDNNLKTAEDWDFLLKLQPYIKKAHIPIGLYFYSINTHGISLTRGKETINASVELVRRYLKKHKIYGCSEIEVVPVDAGKGIIYYDHIINGKSTMKPEARKTLERYLKEGY